MKKSFILFILGISFACVINAQNNADIKAQINKIKRSTLYLSAEATMATEEEALNLARELLVAEINDWVASKRKGAEVKQVVLQDINSCAQQMDMKRGVKTRAFLYVKKKDIVLIYGEGQIMLNDEESGVDLQPLSEISTPLQNDVAADDNALSKAEASSLEKIQDAKTMTDLKPVFASLKDKGKIKYGSYNSQSVLEECYLLFYTREGNISSIVRKRGDKYTDVKSNKAINLSDFNGCGAYWFILQ